MKDEKVKKEFINGLSHNYEKYHGIQDIITAFIAGVNHNKNQMKDLLYALKQVKTVMDSEDYSLDCDRLYDLVASTIDKYENQ